MSEKIRNRQPIHIVISGERAFITGDVYMWKHIVKAHEFRWDHEKKHWHGHKLRADAVRQDLQEAGNIVTVNQDNVLAFDNPGPASAEPMAIPLKFITSQGRTLIALDLSPAQLEHLAHQLLRAVQSPGAIAK
jgi:hypothetical protein